jgi:hypothetical protein
VHAAGTEIVARNVAAVISPPAAAIEAVLGQRGER